MCTRRFWRGVRRGLPLRAGHRCECLHVVLYIGLVFFVVCVIATTLLGVLLDFSLPPPDCGELGCTEASRTCRLLGVNHSALFGCGKNNAYFCSQPVLALSIVDDGNRPGLFFPQQRCRDANAGAVVPLCWTQSVLTVGQLDPCWPQRTSSSDTSNSTLLVLFHRGLDWEGQHSSKEPPVNTKVVVIIVVSIITGWPAVTLLTTFVAISGCCPDSSDSDDDSSSSSSSDTLGRNRNPIQHDEMPLTPVRPWGGGEGTRFAAETAVMEAVMEGIALESINNNNNVCVDGTIAVPAAAVAGTATTTYRNNDGTASTGTGSLY